MFESLDDQIRHDEARVSTSRQRMLQWMMIAVLSVLLFGGLYLAIRMVGSV